MPQKLHAGNNTRPKQGSDSESKYTLLPNFHPPSFVVIIFQENGGEQWDCQCQFQVGSA